MNIPKSKLDDADEPTVNDFYKIGTDSFEFALSSANRPKSTAVSYINRN